MNRGLYILVAFSFALLVAYTSNVAAEDLPIGSACIGEGVSGTDQCSIGLECWSNAKSLFGLDSPNPANAGEKGTCKLGAALNQKCGIPDSIGPRCQAGLTCMKKLGSSNNVGTCQKSTTTSQTTVNVQKNLPMGSACIGDGLKVGDDPCAAGLECMSNKKPFFGLAGPAKAGEAGTCKLGATLNKPCDYTDTVGPRCTTGLVCAKKLGESGGSGKCIDSTQSKRVLNAPCVGKADKGNGACAAGFVCSTKSIFGKSSPTNGYGTCLTQTTISSTAKNLPPGSACIGDGLKVGDDPCAAGLECMSNKKPFFGLAGPAKAGEAGTCKVGAAENKPCDYTDTVGPRCQIGLTCVKKAGFGTGQGTCQKSTTTSSQKSTAGTTSTTSIAKSATITSTSTQDQAKPAPIVTPATTTTTDTTPVLNGKCIFKASNGFCSGTYQKVDGRDKLYCKKNFETCGVPLPKAGVSCEKQISTGYLCKGIYDSNLVCVYTAGCNTDIAV